MLSFNSFAETPYTMVFQAKGLKAIPKFDENGIHSETGTLYGPDGYDQNGFDSNGLDSEGYDSYGFSAKICKYNSGSSYYSYTVGVSRPGYKFYYNGQYIAAYVGSNGVIRNENKYTVGQRMKNCGQQYSTCYFATCMQTPKPTN